MMLQIRETPKEHHKSKPLSIAVIARIAQKKEDAHFDLGGGFDHEIGNSTAAPVEEEKPVVNEVDTKALKNEKPVEKKKKEPEGDGYSHAQPEHIHV